MLLCLCFVVAGGTALLPIQNIQVQLLLGWVGSAGLPVYRAGNKRSSELATTKKEIEARISA